MELIWVESMNSKQGSICLKYLLRLASLPVQTLSLKRGIRNKQLFLLPTKQRAQRLANELKQEGFKAITIHGDLSQRERDNAMYRFKRRY